MRRDPRIDRRTVTRGAAWTLPVVALAAPAPIFAASALICPDDSCYQPLVSTTTAASVTDNQGTVTIIAPAPPSVSGFGFLVTCSGLVSAGV